MFISDSIEEEFSSYPKTPKQWVGLYQINDVYFHEGLIDALIRDNPKQVDAAKKNSKALGWFFGQVMLHCHNKANPDITQRLLELKFK